MTNLHISINNIDINSLATAIDGLIKQNGSFKISYNYDYDITGKAHIIIKDCAYDIESLQIIKKITNKYTYQLVNNRE